MNNKQQTANKPCNVLLFIDSVWVIFIVFLPFPLLSAYLESPRTHEHSLPSVMQLTCLG